MEKPKNCSRFDDMHMAVWARLALLRMGLFIYVWYYRRECTLSLVQAQLRECLADSWRDKDEWIRKMLKRISQDESIIRTKVLQVCSVLHMSQDVFCARKQN